jgi:hypothetical protein
MGSRRELVADSRNVTGCELNGAGIIFRRELNGTGIIFRRSPEIRSMKMTPDPFNSLPPLIHSDQFTGAISDASLFGGNLVIEKSL